jgi:hypothetical protein
MTKKPRAKKLPPPSPTPAPARPRGRPRAQAAQAPSPEPKQTTTPATGSRITSDEDLKRALDALPDPQERKQGEGEGHAGERSTAPQADEPSPVLSPEELVQIAEAASGAGLLLYAVVFGRELPTEQQAAFSDGTRKLLGISAPGTLAAAGEAIQENRELLRWLSPVGFLSGLVTHLVQRGRELRKRGAEREVFVQPPVSSVPIGDRPEVWRPKQGPPPAHVQQPTANGVKPEAQQPLSKFNPPPGVSFGQKRMPRIATYDGEGPLGRGA